MPGPSKPQAVPTVVPHLTVANTAAAIEFYKKAFGAVEIARHATPDGKKIMHAAVLVNGAPIMLNDDFPEYSGKAGTPAALGGSPVTIHLNVPDVDVAWARAVKAGAQVIMPLADQFWGDRYGKLRDPQGHEWSMGTSKNKPTEAELKKGADKAFSKAPLARKPGSGEGTWPRASKAAGLKTANVKKTAKRK